MPRHPSFVHGGILLATVHGREPLIKFVSPNVHRVTASIRLAPFFPSNPLAPDLSRPPPRSWCPPPVFFPSFLFPLFAGGTCSSSIGSAVRLAASRESSLTGTVGSDGRARGMISRGFRAGCLARALFISIWGRVPGVGRVTRCNRGQRWTPFTDHRDALLSSAILTGGWDRRGVEASRHCPLMIVYSSNSLTATETTYLETGLDTVCHMKSANDSSSSRVENRANVFPISPPLISKGRGTGRTQGWVDRGFPGLRLGNFVGTPWTLGSWGARRGWGVAPRGNRKHCEMCARWSAQPDRRRSTALPRSRCQRCHGKSAVVVRVSCDLRHFVDSRRQRSARADRYATAVSTFAYFGTAISHDEDSFARTVGSSNRCLFVWEDLWDVHPLPSIGTVCLVSVKWTFD